MFSKKINKKIAESNRREAEHLKLTHQQIAKLEHRYHHQHRSEQQQQQSPNQIAASLNYGHLQHEEEEDDEDPSSSEIFSSPPPPPTRRSRSRIAAGFINTNQILNPDNNSRQQKQVYSNRSSKIRGGGQFDVDDDEEEEDAKEEKDDNNIQLQGSTDEIMEEFDVDNVELRYPIQDFPSSENLIEYSESNLRKSPSSSQQPSFTKAIFSSSSAKTRRSNEKLGKKSQKTYSPAHIKNINSGGTTGGGSRDDLQDSIENDASGGSSSSRYFDTTNYDNQYESSAYTSRGKERNSLGGGQSQQQQRASRRPSGNTLTLDRQPSTTPMLGQQQSSLNSSMVNMGPLFSSTNSNANMNFQLTPPNTSLNNSSSNNNTFIASSSFDGQRQGSTAAAMNLNAASRDVIPLPIEIPDSVTDAVAFRRYLSVRRDASPYLSNIESNQNDDDDEDDAERSNLESLGRSSSRITGSRSPEILASTTSARLSTNPFPTIGSSSGQKQSNSTQPGGGDAPRTGGLKTSSCPQQPQSPQQDCSLATQYLKKTSSLSHAIMTLALLSSSAAQLRFVVAYSHVHSYPTLNYFLICSCIIIEILVGIGFVVLARFEFQDSFVEKMHSYLIFGLFVVTVANVIVAAFALDDHICDSITKKLQQPPPMTLDQQQQQQLQFDNQIL